MCLWGDGTTSSCFNYALGLSGCAPGWGSLPPSVLRSPSPSGTRLGRGLHTSVPPEAARCFPSASPPPPPPHGENGPPSCKRGGRPAARAEGYVAAGALT